MGWKAIGFEQPNFDEAPLLAMNPFGIVEKDGRIGVKRFGIPKRRIIPAKYDYIERVDAATGIFFIVGLKKKYGVYNSDGKLIIEVIYNKICIKDTFIVVRKGKYCGAYDFKGNHIITDIYSEIISDNEDIVVRTFKKTCGVYDYQGNHIVPDEYVECKFVRFGPDNEEFIFVKTSDGRCGAYNKQGKIIVPIGDYVLKLCDGFIIANGAKPDVKSTVYNYQGDKIMPESERTYGKYNGKLILHGHAGCWHVYDKNGKEVEPGVVYEAIFAHREFLVVKYEGQWKILYSI